MISLWYGLAFKSAFNKEVDFDSDTIKAAMCTSTYTPNQDTHQYFSSITNELSGGNYSQQTLGSKTVNYTSGTNLFWLDCGDVTFAAITATNVRYAIFFLDTGSAATSPLLCYWDFETNLNPTGEDVKLTIAAGGLASVTIS